MKKIIAGLATILACNFAVSDEIENHAFSATGFASLTDIKSNHNSYISGSDHKYGTLIESELGVNASYDVTSHVGVYLGLYYNKAQDSSSIFDYGFVDFSTSGSDLETSYGVRLGKVKNTYGFFNDSRVNPRTRPQIILPQSVYFDAFNKFASRSTGAQFYFNDTLKYGWQVELTAGVSQTGLTSSQANEIKEIYYIVPNLPASFSSVSPSYYTQLQISNNRWQFQYNYSPLKWKYTNELPFPMPFADHQMNMDYNQFGVRYHGSNWIATSEALYGRATFKRQGPGMLPSTSEVLGYYIMGEYDFSSSLRGYSSYGRFGPLQAESEGSLKQIGVDPLNSSLKDFTIGAAYKFNKNWMLKGETHFIEGYITLNDMHTPEGDKQSPWRMYAVSIIYQW